MFAQSNVNRIHFIHWHFSLCFLSINSTVGLQKILSLLESEDANVRIHAVKVVANLAAEGGLSIIRFVNFYSCIDFSIAVSSMYYCYLSYCKFCIIT